MPRTPNAFIVDGGLRLPVNLPWPKDVPIYPTRDPPLIPKLPKDLPPAVPGVPWKDPTIVPTVPPARDFPPGLGPQPYIKVRLNSPHTASACYRYWSGR